MFFARLLIVGILALAAGFAALRTSQHVSAAGYFTYLVNWDLYDGQGGSNHTTYLLHTSYWHWDSCSGSYCNLTVDKIRSYGYVDSGNSSSFWGLSAKFDCDECAYDGYAYVEMPFDSSTGPKQYEFTNGGYGWGTHSYPTGKYTLLYSGACPDEDSCAWFVLNEQAYMYAVNESWDTNATFWAAYH